MNGIIDILPMPPWLGPPFPKFLGIYWPQVPRLPTFAPPEESTYENDEVWAWIDWRGRERKITVTRHARRS